MTSPLQQKLKVSGPVVITANRLADGMVVYRTDDQGWTTLVDAAAIVTSTEAARALLASAVADGGSAVSAYVAPVKIDSDGRIHPGNLREQIRVDGPTFDLPSSVGA